MKKIRLTLILLIFYTTLLAQTDIESNIPVLKGPYLGQATPGLSPEIFAPNIISNGLANRDVTISPDGKEMYFSVHTTRHLFATIVYTKQINGIWTKPEVVSFATDSRYKYLEPTFSYNGNTLFFVTNKPKDGSSKPAAEDIWAVDKIDGKWGDPYNLGEPVNYEGGDFFPSVTRDGTLYFTIDELEGRVSNIYRSRLVNGKYSTPVKLPKQVNCGTNRFNAYVAPDESFVVVPAVGVEKDYKGVHYYIVYRNEDDSWQDPRVLSSKINTAKGTGWSFYISPDKKYIFYMASKQLPTNERPKNLNMDFLNKYGAMPQNGNSDIYWIDAKILKDSKSINPEQ